MNPLPAAQDIPGFYPSGYFTHHASNLHAGALDPSAFRTRAKLAFWEDHFGYRHLLTKADPLARAAARLLGWVPPLVKKLGMPLRFVPFQPGGRLLDLGCGSGDFLALAKQLGWQVRGLEPDPSAAAVVRAAEIPVEIGTVDSADYPEGHFDAITLSHVLEHFLDPVAAISRIARWLKPGGTLVTITPNPCSTVAELFGPYWYSLDAPRHLVLPSPGAVQKLMESATLRAAVFAVNYRDLEIARASAQRMGSGGRMHVARALLMYLLRRWSDPPEIAPGEDIFCVATKPLPG